MSLVDSVVNMLNLTYNSNIGVLLLVLIYNLQLSDTHHIREYCCCYMNPNGWFLHKTDQIMWMIDQVKLCFSGNYQNVQILLSGEI